MHADHDSSFQLKFIVIPSLPTTLCRPMDPKVKSKSKKTKSKSLQSCCSLGSWRAVQQSSFELIIGRLSATDCIDPEQARANGQAGSLACARHLLNSDHFWSCSTICITLDCPREMEKQIRTQLEMGAILTILIQALSCASYELYEHQGSHPR